MAAGSRARGRAHGGVGRHLAVPLVMVLVFGGIAGGSYLALERYGSPAHEGTCVASGLGTSHRSAAAWTAAGMFLAFWLPLNNGLRPEPAVVFFSLLTWVSVERAIATGRMLPVAIAVSCSADRQALGKITADGVFLEQLETDPAQDPLATR